MNRYQWLEELHRTYYDTLVRLARLRLKQRGASVEDAEDIVQQAFLLAAQKDISGHAAPAQWLMKTVANLCMSGAARQRKAKRLQQRLIRRRMDSSPVRSAYAVETQPDATAEQEVQLLIEPQQKGTGLVFSTPMANFWCHLIDLSQHSQR